ncbi:arginyl-tRNA--protein-N-Asp/Glu arginylyltransferase [Ochrobactrum sp. P20RRXII]|nr:arginyl-tRNA--protein-N-Asp/Glu arginylyltransferase [Ochrobactrum sp. P20RRXII]
MSSKIIKPYFGPTDFRMMREILRRAGYRLYDTAENRTAHLVAAKLLIQEFQSGRSQSRRLSKFSRRHTVENVDGSPAVI